VWCSNNRWCRAMMWWSPRAPAPSKTECFLCR
jgi:hypothetical protein